MQLLVIAYKSTSGLVYDQVQKHNLKVKQFI